MSALEESKAAKRKINGGKQYHVKGQLNYPLVHTNFKRSSKGIRGESERDFSCRGWCAVAVVAAS